MKILTDLNFQYFAEGGLVNRSGSSAFSTFIYSGDLIEFPLTVELIESLDSENDL
jgi:hypothetical protein